MNTEKSFYKEKPGGKIIYSESMKCDHGIAFCVKTNVYLFCFKTWRDEMSAE